MRDSQMGGGISIGVDSQFTSRDLTNQIITNEIK